MTQLTTERLTALMAPISADAPSGIDLNYSLLFDEIREARRYDDPALDQGAWEKVLKTADWRKVIALCQQALQQQSKDLQLIVWYCEALTQVHGFKGASFGLRALDAWLQQYWETGYPQLDPSDLDERIGKIEWLNQQLGMALRTVPITNPVHGGYHWHAWRQSREVENLGLKDTASRDHAIAEGKLSGEVFDKSVQASGIEWYRALSDELNQTWNSYQELDASSMERFGEEFPSLADLYQSLQALRDTVERLMMQQFGTSPTASAAPAVQPQSEPMPAAVPLTKPVSATTSGPLQSRADALRMLNEVARYFRANEPHSPVALLAERAARWGEMSIEDWLAHVVKDESTLRQLNELLGVKSKA